MTRFDKNFSLNFVGLMRRPGQNAGRLHTNIGMIRLR